MAEWTSGIMARAYQHISMQASDHRCGGVLLVELYCHLSVVHAHLAPSCFNILHFVQGPCRQLLLSGKRGSSSSSSRSEPLSPITLLSNSTLGPDIMCCHPKLMSQFSAHGQVVDASDVASMSARPNKVVIVGDVGTGKTSILRRIVSNQFDPEYTHSNSADIGLMRVVLGSSMPAAYLQLWDIPSYNDFPDSPSMYYEDGDALGVMVDVGNEESLENVSTWLAKVHHHVSSERISDRVALRTGAQARQSADTSQGLAFPVFMMANKVDLPPEEWEMTMESVEMLASSLNLDGVYVHQPPPSYPILFLSAADPPPA
jgi:GTPase SAR1 family protein